MWWLIPVFVYFSLEEYAEYYHTDLKQRKYLWTKPEIDESQ